jgi:hypothetical protein
MVSERKEDMKGEVRKKKRGREKKKSRREIR